MNNYIKNLVLCWKFFVSIALLLLAITTLVAALMAIISGSYIYGLIVLAVPFISSAYMSWMRFAFPRMYYDE